MAKSNQLELLKKLIREEVVNAIRQEMPAILKEIQSSSSPKEVIKESKRPKMAIPGTLNTQPVRMLATARPSSDPSMVQINEVPDFSALMSKLKAKGAI
jgi:hypothetical protein